MREIAGLRRDEEGVSAAVATVLLFGGVLSLIGMMLITMLPVIQELEGSIERNSMLSQMNEYATQTVRLAESGMPGDGVSLEFETLDGELLWDNMRGGSWLSATWTENQSLRIRDAMDLDRDVEFRYPSGEIGSICWDDMRLGPDRSHYTRIANISGKVLVVPKIGIAENLMPVELILSQGSKSVSGIIHGSSIWSAELPLPESSGEAWLQANNQVDVYLLRGEGGATEAPPIDDNPVTGQGKSWMVPLDVGTTELNMVGKDTMRIDWIEGENYGSEIVVAGGGFFSEGASWSRSFTVAEPAVVKVTSSSDARLLMVRGDIGSGDAPWPALTGALIGTEFLPPAAEGVLFFDNPTSDAVVIHYLGGSLSVAANDTLRINWPPGNAVGAPLLTSDAPIQLHWMQSSTDIGANRTGSLALYPASDTGRISGHHFNLTTPTKEGDAASTTVAIQVAGIESSWNISTWNISGSTKHSDSMPSIGPNDSRILRMEVVSGDSVRVIISTGDDGLAHIPNDGVQRCTYVGMQASGWIAAKLPWQSSAELDATQIEMAWRNGEHPSSMILRVYSNDVENPHSALATVWAFHMPSLAYSFESSITGVETSTRGGAVMTNHPEMQASVIRAPSDRAGPGPRFAATVPIAYPIGDSITGSANVEVDLTLAHRHQLTSSLANEVRRGWDGPYGPALAGLASEDLSYSNDWTTFPQQLQLLNDYKGWVPDPAPDSSETVYHTQGEPIQFTLQVSVLYHVAQEDLM